MGANGTVPAGFTITAAALLLGACNACTSAIPGVPWIDMDAGDTGSADLDADIDTDADIGTDIDVDSDTDTDSDVDAGDTEVGPVWRFAAFGDSRGSVSTGGVNEAILSAIATAVLDDGVDLVIFVGDLVSGSSVPETLEARLVAWRDIMEILYEAGVAVYPVRGNHDNGAFEPWNTVFSGPYAVSDAGPEGEENKTFAVEHENALFLGFDLYFTPHRVNQAWLDEQLAATTAEHIFAFGHEPAYAANHADCLDDYPDERDAFIHSLVTAGGRVYFAGHDHFYARALVEGGYAGPGFYQIIIGTAGAPPYTFDNDYGGDNGDASVEDVYSDSPYGYILVEIDGAHATFTWKKMISPDAFEAVETFEYTVGEK